MPEGRYRPKVELGRADRTIVLPNPINRRRDRARPCGSSPSGPRALSPDGDGRGDIVRVRYRASEPGSRAARRQRAPARRQPVTAAGRRAPVGRWGAGRREAAAWHVPARGPGSRPRRESLAAGSGGGRAAALRPSRGDARHHGARRERRSRRRGGRSRASAGSFAADRASSGVVSRGERCASTHRRARAAMSLSRQLAATPTVQSSLCAGHDRSTVRPRRQPVGHDTAQGHPRPLAGDRNSRRDVLHPAARSQASGHGRRRELPRRPPSAAAAGRLGCACGRPRRPAAPRDAHGRGDRGGLLGVRGQARQAALGGQDAAVHAPPRPHRPALPGRPVRAPHPRRPRRRARVPRHAGRRGHEDVGASA